MPETEGSSNRAQFPAGVNVVAWRPGAAPSRLTDWRTAGKPGQGVIWIDLDGVVEWEATADAIEAMRTPGLERGMLGYFLQGVPPDGFRADEVPWYDPRSARRLLDPGLPTFLKAFGLRPEIRRGHWDPPWVFVQPVDFLVTERCVLTNRRPSHASDGTEARSGPPVDAAELAALAEARWQGPIAEPADLALLFLRQLAGSYPQALRKLEMRLQDLQQEYIRRISGFEVSGLLDEQGYRDALLRVEWVTDTLTAWIADIERPATDPLTAWLPASTTRGEAEQVKELIEFADQLLRHLRGQLRSSFTLISSTQASEQLEATRRLQESSTTAEGEARRFTDTVQYVAALFLLPSFWVAAVGAMPDTFSNCLPARVALVWVPALVLAIAGYCILSRRRTRRPVDPG